ncbi:MAG: thiamine pyrophosphate-binding protein [Bdellovibrionaceae bacterium]|nr:thiamine pyrophosphate-binding protein [Pseudobdellovibrionaceae bacterium]
MTNILQCRNLIQDLYDKGVRSFVLCAGARNAAFIECFSKLTVPDHVDVHWGFEERSASFFALGRAKQTGLGAAVFTTSGTALVETHAALVEAYYSSVPLVVVSADRPQKLWGTGAPQTIIQKDIFATQLGPTVSWTDHEHLKKVTFPFHINCPMHEPLIDEPMMEWKFNTSRSLSEKDLRMQGSFEPFNNLDLNMLLTDYEDIKKPFFIISGLNSKEHDDVKFLNEMAVPVYVESTAEDLGFKNRVSAMSFNMEFIRKNFDAVIRIGGIPTHKLWRQLEEERGISVLNFSSLKFPGRSDSQVHSIKVLKDFISKLELDSLADILGQLQEQDQKIEKIIKKNSISEMNFYLEIKKKLKDTGAHVFVGNSLPIRMWDIAGFSKSFKAFANRGVNGIDGLLSTAYGLAYKNEHPVVAIVGDLSALYDLTAPWFFTQDKRKFDIKIIIVNNMGGQIFAPLFDNPKFINSHKINFKGFASLWGLKYSKVEDAGDIPSFSEWPNIMEIGPDNEQTAKVWQEIKKLSS